MSSEAPSHVAGYTVMRKLRVGVFGADYLGHSSEGLRLVKLLREGEGLAVPEEAYAALAGDAHLLHFEAGAALSQDQRVLTAHTLQAAAFGVLVGGSPLQNECLETTREFDTDQRVASTLRGTTLVQRVQLLLQVAKAVARLHEAGRTHPYVTPWNVVLDADQARLAEVGLGYRPDDPKFDAARVPEDVLVYLAPEVQRAIAQRTVVQVSPAADVYALAATARSVLLNHVADPAPSKQPAAARRDLVLAGAGLRLDPHKAYSRELEALLKACLSPDPSRRPTAAQLAARLDELVRADRVAYTPPPVWPLYAGISAGVVAALLLVIFVVVPLLRGPADLVKARRAYAAATRQADLAAREEALKAATVTLGEGKVEVLPEARRLLAVTRYVRWARSQKDAAAAPAEGAPDLAAVLAELEREVVTGHTDGLAQATRLVVATLRRWELGGPAREAADKALDELARADVRPEALRDLAAAARALTATGEERRPSPDELTRWAEAAASASADAGFLAQGYPAHAERDGYEADPEVQEKPVAVGLDSAWLGRLIAGRVQTLLGRHEDARSKLAAAHDVSTFATAAAYGLELAARATRPEDLALARKLLDAARARRGPFAEALLAQGRIELREAHAAGQAAGYARAADAFQQATGVPADTPGLDVAKAALELELAARLHEAAALAATPEQADEALRRLDALARRIQDALPAALDTYGPDLGIARGVARANKGQPAAADLAALFKGGQVAQGFAELPPLDPPPVTRALGRAKAIQAITAENLARAEALSATPKREDVAAAERALDDVLRIAAMPEAKGALDMARVHLAHARVLIGKFLTSDGRAAEDALAAARKAYQDARDAADVATPEGAQRWLDALKGRLDIAARQLQKLGQAASIEQALPVLRQARKDLAEAAAGVPRPVQRLFEAFLPDQQRGLRLLQLEKVEAWAEQRRAEWNAIDVAAPRYPEDVATQELATLEETADLFRVDGRYEAQDHPLRFRLGTLLRWMSLLDRARRLNPKVYEHTRAALELTDPIDAHDEPRVEPLRERLNYLVGWVALNEGASLAGQLSDPKAFGYDALARAAGARDFNDLRARVASKDGFTARSPDAVRAIAADIVATYESGPQAVPPDPKPGTELRGAREIMQRMDFATRIDARNAGAFLILARVQFSMGPEQYEPAFRNAQRAYELAQAAGPQGLGTLVQASRLYCYARSQMPGSEEAIAGQELRAIATRGRDAARDLFQRDQAAQNASFNYGPAYWVAKSFYVKGQQLRAQNKTADAIAELDQAVRAYDEFERLVAGRDAPAEAAQADHVREKLNANNLLRVLRSTR
ncbi:MAG: protein kinase [Planctomycetes bacterium]|nr:protein kinase [Planctomycetota bacterium]